MDFRKINRFWQSLTLLLGPIAITLLIIFKGGMSLWIWLLWLHLPLLWFHEAEEYVFAPMDFVTFVNLKTVLGSGTDPDQPVSQGYTFLVNVGTFWLLIILGALLGNIAPWLGMSVVVAQLVMNGLTHTIVFQGRKPSYNPGLLTTSILLIPYCIVMIVVAASFFAWWDWVLSVTLGIGLFAAFLSTTLRLKKTASYKAV